MPNLLQQLREASMTRVGHTWQRCEVRWPGTCGAIAQLYTRVRPYYGWHQEIQEHFNHSNRAGRLYRGLPLLLLGFAMSVAGVWSTNWMAREMTRLVAEFFGVGVQLMGSLAFSPNIYSKCMAVGLGLAFAFILSKKVFPDMRAATGVKKAGYVLLAVFVILWGLLTVAATAFSGIDKGFEAMIGGFLYAVLFALSALTLVGFVMVFVGWFWLTKVLSIYWWCVGLLLSAITWKFGLDVALFLAEHTKWLYPENLHHAFDLMAPVGIPVTEWLVKLNTWIATVVPWVVELRMLLGFRRDGDTYRTSDYYQRWCLSPREEFPPFWAGLKDAWLDYISGVKPSDDELSWRNMFTELKRDVLD